MLKTEKDETGTIIKDVQQLMDTSFVEARLQPIVDYILIVADYFKKLRSSSEPYSDEAARFNVKSANATVYYDAFLDEFCMSKNSYAKYELESNYSLYKINFSLEKNKKSNPFGRLLLEYSDSEINKEELSSSVSGILRRGILSRAKRSVSNLSTDLLTYNLNLRNNGMYYTPVAYNYAEIFKELMVEIDNGIDINALRKSAINQFKVDESRFIRFSDWFSEALKTSAKKETLELIMQISKKYKLADIDTLFSIYGSIHQYKRSENIKQLEVKYESEVPDDDKWMYSMVIIIAELLQNQTPETFGIKLISELRKYDNILAKVLYLCFFKKQLSNYSLGDVLEHHKLIVDSISEAKEGSEFEISWNEILEARISYRYSRLTKLNREISLYSLYRKENLGVSLLKPVCVNDSTNPVIDSLSMINKDNINYLLKSFDIVKFLSETEKGRNHCADIFSEFYSE